jgi:hypothetical protein
LGVLWKSACRKQENKNEKMNKKLAERLHGNLLYFWCPIGLAPLRMEQLANNPSAHIFDDNITAIRRFCGKVWPQAD